MNKQRRMKMLRWPLWVCAACAVFVASTSYAGTTSYRDAVLADNPIIYYQFDEASGTSAANSGSAGVTNDGTIQLGTVTVNQASFAQGGTAYDFGGGIVEAAALPSSLSEWTIEAWVNWNPAKTTASNIFGNDQGGWNNDVILGIGAENGGVGVPSGSVGLVQQGAPDGPRDFVADPLTQSQWHHVVVTASTANSELILYVDGTEVDRDVSFQDGIVLNGAGGIGSPFIAIGAARNVVDAGYRSFVGLIDEFAIYGTALDAAAILNHYAASGETPPDPPDPPDPPSSSGFGLEVSEYAPGASDSVTFNWATHIAFGPGNQEIITDLKNNRFLYRDGPDAALEVSPIPVKGQHSVIYNPADSLYYANDTDNNRLIAFADLSSATIAAQTNNILGVSLNRPHDIVIDPATGWIYALNPNSGHVFRFSAIGQNESVLSLGGSVGGYSRSLTFVNGTLYVIGSAAGRIVEVVDWDTGQVNVYNSFGKIRSASAGSWSTTGLVLNDAEFFNGFWYASSYFSATHAGGSDPNENKFIRFATLADFVSGNWEDLSSLVPDGFTPYYLTVQGNSLYLAIFGHGNVAGDDVILQFNPASPFSITAIQHDDETDTTTLTWESNEGELFEVSKSLDLDSWVVLQPEIAAAVGPAKTTTVIVDTDASEPQAFYRVGRLSE
ncbi:MAG: hypothetical protein L7T84_00370 [Akkermansiaceae bacterium]|nr:hypothetical protein [Akkermansiaceae bacterium]